VFVFHDTLYVRTRYVPIRTQDAGTVCTVQYIYIHIYIYTEVLPLAPLVASGHNL
jgi:hypothetical protein